MKHKFYDKKHIITSFFLGFLIATLQVLGYSFSKKSNWSLVIQNGEIQWKMVIIWIGISIIFSALIFVFFLFLRYEEEKDIIVGRIRRKYIIAIAILILICWSPYIVINYPCSFNPDVGDQLGQVFHNSELCWTRRYVNLKNPSVSFWNNHHPVTHTVIVGGFAKIGLFLGDIRRGLFLMVLVQVILMAGVFSYIICYLRKKGTPKKICVGIFCFYALWPIHALTVDSLCKDTLFTIFILLATIILVELFHDSRAFLTWKMTIFTCFVFIMQGLMRNNGLYLLIAIFPIAIILGKGVRGKIVCCFLVPILFLGLFMPKVVLPAASIAPGGEKEMYSVPLQQIARTVKEHRDSFTKEDLKVIEEVMNQGKSYRLLQKKYTPNNADPIKNSFKLNITKDQRIHFFKIWFKYLKKHPTVYIQATMNNNYEYFYYERYGNVLYYNGIQVKNGSSMGLYNVKKFEITRMKLWDTMVKIQHNKWLGWTVNIGFYMCFLIVLLVYALINKKYRLFWAYGFIVCNILINLLGPLVYMRYAYYFIASIPLIFGLLCCKDIKNQGE